MTRADFEWVNFDHTFNAVAPVAVRTFQVDGTPIAANPTTTSPNGKAVGYVLVQAFDVENSAGPAESQHRIKINNIDLPSFDIPVEGRAWQTWMDRIPPGVLVQGDNRISITKGNGDPSFRVANVAVHWRETD